MKMKVFKSIFDHSLGIIKKSFLFLLIMGVSGPSVALAQPSHLTPEAQVIFEKYHRAVVQIRVISRASKEKSALGSGFFLTSNGLMATNYHVVSDAVNFPNLYFVEFIQPDGKRGDVEILNLDPVHDLAILKTSSPVTAFLEPGDDHIKKGTKIFSFGNPYDLGLIIVEGLYNGLMEYSRYPKILFSGSINPGMSGGPAVNEDGKVIGINVATAGNEISFFVPVNYLAKLLEELKSKNGKPLATAGGWKPLIGQRLRQEDENFVNHLVGQPQWNKRFFAGAEVPGEISPAFRCWGESGDNQRYWVVGNYLTCSTEDDIFVSSTLRTGRVFFEYSWYQARGNDPIRFYNIYEDYAKSSRMEIKNAAERDATNFECRQDIVQLGKRRAFVEFCGRKYKMYDHLYDVVAKISQVDELTQGLTINFGAFGVSQMQGQRLFEKFLQEIVWHKSY